MRSALNAAGAAGRNSAVQPPCLGHILRVTGQEDHVHQRIDLKQRAAREGRAAGDAYQGFWDALRRAVRDSDGYIEGVRLRLYLIAFEALAADDVLDGVYRKALEDGRVEESRDEAQELLSLVERRVTSDEMRRFAESSSVRSIHWTEAVIGAFRASIIR